MTNEIKEILYYLAFLEDIETQKKVKQLENYIINLQQRIDKALEYIENECGGNEAVFIGEMLRGEDK